MRIVESITTVLTEAAAIESIKNHRAPRALFNTRTQRWAVWTGGEKSSDRRFHGELEPCVTEDLNPAEGTYQLGIEANELVAAPWVDTTPATNVAPVAAQ